MPVTRSEQIFRIRDLLDRPYPNAPGFTDMLRQELSEERDIVNALNNTGVPWGVAEYTINYTPVTDTYPINVPDFGKVLFCVKATTNYYIPYLPVPFQNLEDQLYGTVWSWFNNNYAQAFALQETPERMSFYRQGVLNSQPSVKIQPMPQEAAQYVICYLPGYLGNDDPLESGIQLPEHAELVRLRAAMALLNYAKWSDDEAENRLKRADLAKGFEYQLARKEALFSKYITSINRPRTVSVEDWNSFA